MESKHDMLTRQELLAELAELRIRLEEAEDTLRAIREGEVDAIIVSGSKGDRVFSLTEAENLHRLMVETMSEAGIATSPEGTVLFCNRRACTLLGVNQKQILGHALNEFVVRHDAKRIETLLVTARTKTTDGRILFVHRDGTPVPMHIWASLLGQPDGAMICLVGTDLSQLETDKDIIAQLREQQEALRQSEERIQQALQASHSFTFEWLPATDEVLRSASCEAILGLGGEEACHDTGRRYFQRVHHEDRDRLMRMLDELSPGENAYKIEYRVERGDGGIAVLEENGQAHFDAAGKMERLVGVTTDITRRKRTEEELAIHRVELEMQNEELRRAQEELAVSQRKYADLYDLAPVGYFVLDLKGSIVEANLAGTAMLGTERRWLAGKPFNSFVAKESQDALHMHRQTARKEGRANACELKIARKDGVLDVAVVIHAQGEGKDTQYMMTVMDITERKRAEESLRQSREQLRQHAEKLETRVKERTAELAKTVVSLREEVDRRMEAEIVLEKQAGQLRSLASELTLAEQRERRRLAQVLHDDLQQLMVAAKFRLAPLKREQSEHVRRAAAEADELMRQSIEASRTLAGELCLPVLHEKGLTMAMEWLQQWMNEKYGLAIELSIPEPLKVTGEDVEMVMFHSMRELLFNIVKHAQAGSARVLLEQKAGRIRAVISDDGVGFDASKLNNLSGVGGGFGLFSIQERLAAMGGRLSVESVPGKGCRTTLLSPPLKELMGGVEVKPNKRQSRKQKTGDRMQKEKVGKPVNRA